MKKLMGFLKYGDDWTLASVGTDHLQRKKLYPTKHDSKAGAQSLYVRECLSHKNTVVIRIVLYMGIEKPKNGNWNWEEIAEALVCPLCWKVMKVFENEEDWILDHEIIDGDESSIRKTSYKRKLA